MARAEAMPAEQAAALADFARTAKAAARAVTLYPATHPAIQGALGRVVNAAARLTAGNPVTLTVEPDAIAVDGAAPARPDTAIRELAELLHDRLIGSLRIEPEADAQDWLAMLLLLGRAADELIAGGGIGKAWSATGRGHFEIREIDYAAVLRERAGGQGAEWHQIIAHCLQGDASTLDERAIASMVDTFGDVDRLREFLDTLQTVEPGAGGPSVGVRAAALLHLLRRALDTSSEDVERTEHLLQTVADSAARLSPEMMLALIGEGRATGGTHKDAVDAVVARMGDGAIASFVANSVIAERGATARLVQAFQALVPLPERKERLLELARADAEDSPIGAETGFQDLWQSAASMLTSYSDSSFVSADYGRELSGARSQAIEIDRVSDDPPDRVQAWLSTVEDAAIQQLDLQLLLDLLRLERDPAEWQLVASRAAVSEIERRTLLGRIDDALQLADAIAGDAALIEALAAGPLVRNIAVYLRRGDESDVEPLNRLARAVGPGIARPIAEALAVEDNARAVRRLRELLLGFGAAGRQSVEQLKSSSNPSVRRMAIDLLRIFGGSEALPELASMLDDADPQVQREAIRAIVQIATEEAYAVLERALVAGSASRDTVLRELIDLRDDKAIPLLCYVLNHSSPRRGLVDVHTQIIGALGALSAHDESTRTLRAILYRGDWWAPLRTAALRRAAATALRRIGAPDTIAVLEEAAAGGSRGVRAAARAQLDAGARRRP